MYGFFSGSGDYVLLLVHVAIGPSVCEKQFRMPYFLFLWNTFFGFLPVVHNGHSELAF